MEIVGLEGYGGVAEGPTTADVNGRLVVRRIPGPTPGEQVLTVNPAHLNRILAVQAEDTEALDPWPFTEMSTGENPGGGARALSVSEA